jgi:hypothetical protein
MTYCRNWPTTSLVATVGVLALFAVSCGDGGSSPVTPTPPGAATPPPSTEPPSSGGSGASACQLGEGNPYAPCEKRLSELWEYVEAAMNTLVQERPELFNLDVEAGDGTRQYRVDDKEGYLEGLVATLGNMGLCAGRAHYDSEIVQVKLNNDFSEDFDVYTSDGFMWRGAGTYRKTCSPASFPIPRPADAPPVGSGCGWPYPPPVSKMNVKVHLTATDFDTLDATPLVGHDQAYCRAIGYTDNRGHCPVRPEGHPEREACETWAVGAARDTGRIGPTWTNPTGGYCTTRADSGCVSADNQYNLWAYWPGKYKACAANGACGTVDVN